MNLQTLKIGQKVSVHLFSKVKESTVREMTEEHVMLFIPPSYNWDNGWVDNGWGIYLNYDGTQRGSRTSAVDYDTRPIGDLKIISIEGEAV